MFDLNAQYPDSTAMEAKKLPAPGDTPRTAQASKMKNGHIIRSRYNAHPTHFSQFFYSKRRSFQNRKSNRMAA
jgi:hypothetical protein